MPTFLVSMFTLLCLPSFCVLFHSCCSHPQVLRFTLFLAAASANPNHPCHYLLSHQPLHRASRLTPQVLYTDLLSTIHKHSNSHIHSNFMNIAIEKLGPNTILGIPPPEIENSELTLPRGDRVHLSMFRCGHHLALVTYHKRMMTPSTKSACTVTLPTIVSHTSWPTVPHSHTLGYNII